MKYPKFFLVKQNFENNYIENIPKTIAGELSRINLRKTVNKKESVAITCGSRGISNISIIIKSIVEYLRSIEAKPFIFPAMGSHGNATAGGQKDIIAHYGITEDSMNCPIRSTMEVVEIGKNKYGLPILVDKFAYNSDHIIIVNRIKAHTTLYGKLESGLVKMCLIGMGNHEGARLYHRFINRYSFNELIDSSLDILIDSLPILCGIGIVENAYEKTSKILAIKKENFYSSERSLLEESKKNMAKLPFADIDLLIVDEMGKDISGTGMDTNVTGRKSSANSDTIVKKIFVRDLSEKTYGNANGIGLADYTTSRLVDKIDFNALYTNSQTAYRTDSCKIPMTLSNDRKALEVALNMIGLDEDYSKARIVWIKNTLSLYKILVSEVYKDAILSNQYNKGLEILEENIEINFDEKGNFIEKK